MDKNTQITNVLQKLQSSTMSEKEKTMWTILLPSMEESHITKLEASLDKEINNINELYLDTLTNRNE